jgi:hypothetical protein
MVADIDPDLLQTANRHERSDGIGNWPQAAKRHSCRHAGHVGFSDSTVIESPRTLFFERIKEFISDIARQKDDPFIRFGKRC